MTVHKCDANISPITVISSALHSIRRHGMHSVYIYMHIYIYIYVYISSWSCKSLLRPDRRVAITGVNRPWHNSLASSRYRSSRHLKFTREQTGSLTAERLAFYRCRSAHSAPFAVSSSTVWSIGERSQPQDTLRSPVPAFSLFLNLARTASIEAFPFFSGLPWLA